eukprot:TRINITY_DN5443_c0_g1_i1.p1 TRINITY_DN5443_c0_g1~~TRINITY_DN5443_c0_g1_i1.p1  ORF type:complete len:297 (+),score=23.95 TRINITY_DN5443_c0_g1_i1:63-953(+)
MCIRDSSKSTRSFKQPFPTQFVQVQKREQRVAPLPNIFEKTLRLCPDEFSMDDFKLLCLGHDGKLAVNKELTVGVSTSLTFELTKRLVIILSFAPHREPIGIVHQKITAPAGLNMLTGPSLLPSTLTGLTNLELKIVSPVLNLSELPILEVKYYNQGRILAPLPVTINKFCDFSSIDSLLFRSGWRSFRVKSCLIRTNSFETSRQILKCPTDILTFFPTLCSLHQESLKVNGFQKTEYKFGGLFVLLRTEFYIKFQMDNTTKMSIKILPLLENPSGDIIIAGETLLHTLSFLLRDS